MSFLLDTNVVSEWVKPRPDPRVVAWLAGLDEDAAFLSVVTIAELQHGIERLAASRRRQQLGAWLEDELLQRFEDRVLPIDVRIARGWAAIVARRERAGRPVGVMDALIAATAAAHGLTLVSRNASDFRSSVEAVFDPWTEA